MGRHQQLTTSCPKDRLPPLCRGPKNPADIDHRLPGKALPGEGQHVLDRRGQPLNLGTCRVEIATFDIHGERCQWSPQLMGSVVAELTFPGNQFTQTNFGRSQRFVQDAQFLDRWRRYLVAQLARSETFRPNHQVGDRR